MLSANISRETRRAIYRRDHYRCALCDSPRSIQVHHVIKRSQGGSNSPENLITLCMYCHAVIHGTRLPDYPEWMNQEELSRAAVEYVADYYAGSWWPWKDTYQEMRRKEGGG